MLNRRLFLTTAAAASLAAPAILRAQTRALTCGCWVPANNVVVRDILLPWFEILHDATRGRVDVRLEVDPTNDPVRQYAAVARGDYDIGFSQHGYVGPERFTRARIGQLPFLGDSYGTSIVFADIYRNQLDASSEHADVALLGLFTHGPGALFLRNQVLRDAKQLEGLSIATPGGHVDGLLGGLGADVPVVAPAELRDRFATGAIQGAAFPMHVVPRFGFADREFHATTFPGGLFNATWFAAMNAQSFARLSDRDRDTVVQVSQEVVGPLAGKAFDEADHIATEACLRLGMKIDRASDALVEQVAAISHGFEMAWADEVAAQGFDGARALSDLRRMTGQAQL